MRRYIWLLVVLCGCQDPIDDESEYGVGATQADIDQAAAEWQAEYDAFADAHPIEGGIWSDDIPGGLEPRDWESEELPDTPFHVYSWVEGVGSSGQQKSRLMNKVAVEQKVAEQLGDDAIALLDLMGDSYLADRSEFMAEMGWIPDAPVLWYVDVRRAEVQPDGSLLLDANVMRYPDEDYDGVIRELGELNEQWQFAHGELSLVTRKAGMRPHEQY